MTSARTHWRWLLLWAYMVLLPFGSLCELPMLIAVLVGLADAWKSPSLITAQGPGRWLGLLFLAYWLPELLSAADSVAPAKSWLEVVADLRLLPFAWFTVVALRSSPARLHLLTATAGLLTVWSVDALIQAATGYGMGGPMLGDRVSGIFSDDNLKLGPVLATLAPLSLFAAWQRWRWPGLGLAWLLVGLAVLLAGARAAWLSYAIVTLIMLWRSAGSPRRFIALGLAAGVIAFAGLGSAYLLSDRVQARVQRTLQAFNGTERGLDDALAMRLPIWSVSVRMARANPLNGVGVRAFRYAYPEYAQADDIWLTIQPGRGALHAHQIVLEIWTETGLIGLVLWLAGLILVLRRWRAASVPDRTSAWPWAVALVSMCFPLNTHLAFYSNFWGGLFWCLLAIVVAQLSSPIKADEGAG